MEQTRIKRVNDKVYTILIFSVDGEIYWRVTGYVGDDEEIAKILQEKCDFPISEYGFSDFGIIDGTAYWESRAKSTIKE